jgi:hypothetical protein
MVVLHVEAAVLDVQYLLMLPYTHAGQMQWY